MGSKLYVGKLSYNMTGSELEQLFSPHGTVQSAEIIADRDTGRSKGFGFVQMKSDEEAKAAIGALNGQEIGGRALTVNEAKPREERPRSGGGGGGGRGGFGGGGGGRRCRPRRLRRWWCGRRRPQPILKDQRCTRTGWRSAARPRADRRSFFL